MLNGLLRKLYGDEESRSSITVEFLLGQVFKDTDATAEQVGALFTLCERIISRAALELWDLSTFEEMVAKTSLSPMQQDVLSKFWRAKRPLIQAALTSKSEWSNHLKELGWRIDVHARSKSSPSLENTTALIELTIEHSPVVASASGSSQSIVRFEMDRQQLAQTRHELTNIQEHLRKLASHE